LNLFVRAGKSRTVIRSHLINGSKLGLGEERAFRTCSEQSRRPALNAGKKQSFRGCVRIMDLQFSLSAQRPVILSGAPRHVSIRIDPMARSRRTPRIMRHPCCIKTFLRGTGTIRAQILKENFLKLYGLSKISVTPLSAPLSEVDIRSAWRCVQDDRVINPLKSLTLSSSHTDPSALMFQECHL
jgi:hypothetical protein